MGDGELVHLIVGVNRVDQGNHAVQQVALAKDVMREKGLNNRAGIGLVIECTGMADPGPIIQTFFSHDILCQRYLLDGVIALVDAVHADDQMNSRRPAGSAGKGCHARKRSE